MLTGLNHLTLAVTDLSRSMDFYARLLHFRLVASWETGAYLALGDLWLCLSLDLARADEISSAYTHYAFSIPESEFLEFQRSLRAAGVQEWKLNRSEGDSFYFSILTATSSKPMLEHSAPGWPSAANGPMRVCDSTNKSRDRTVQCREAAGAAAVPGCICQRSISICSTQVSTIVSRMAPRMPMMATIGAAC